jgi:hypothetical protein
MRHLDLLGNAINGPSEYVTTTSAFSLGGGVDVLPGTTMLVPKARAIGLIQTNSVRRATPQEIAAYESDPPPAVVARNQEEDAVAAGPKQDAAAIEAEIERRVAERVAAREEELEAEVKRRVEQALAEADGGDDDDSPKNLGDITNADPKPTHRDPGPGGSRRGGRST